MPHHSSRQKTVEVTVKQIADIIDAATLKALGVKDRSLRKARHEGQFPSSWYDIVDARCRKVGIPCPRSLFTFKSPSSRPSSEADGSEVLAGNANGSAATQRQPLIGKRTGDA